MARNFDGANDNIDFGSDASIDGYTTKVSAGWVINNADLTAVPYLITGKDRFFTRWAVGGTGDVGTDKLCYAMSWSGANGEWRSTTDMGTTRHHFVIVYNGGASTNDPVLYLDGALETMSEFTTPSGTLTADSTQNLRSGETAANSLDWNGKLCCLVYDNTIANWDAAAASRARFWGRPHGGLKVYHPFYTSKLTNEGTATANGTASGSTMTDFAVPAVRPGSWLLGMGVGW